MQEIGIESSLVEAIKTGDKTTLAVPGLPQYLRVQEDDGLSIREDFWYESKILESLSHALEVTVTQVLYFETFKELLQTVDFQSVIPTAKSIEDATKKCLEYTAADDEKEYGVIAFMFEIR